MKLTTTSPRFALLFSFITEYLSQLITLVSVVILARILSPQEYGTYSLALTMIMLFQHITAFGVGQYIIKANEITYNQLRSAVGFTYLSAWGLGFFIIMIAPYASEFYNEKGIKNVLYILSIYFFLTPLGGVTESFLKRNLEFKLLAKIILAAKFLQIPFTITLAFNGFGYLSLAWGLVFEKALFVIFLYRYIPENLTLKPRFKEFSEIFKFGSKLSFYGFSKQTRNSFVELFIGKLFSMDQVGFFARALGAVQLFNRLITKSIVNVLLPILSKDKRESKKSSYLMAVTYFTAFSFPFYVFMFILAEPIVYILYGDQWGQSVPLLRVLCIWAAIASIYSFSGQELISSGKENSLITQEVILFPASLIIVGISSLFGVYYMVSSLILIAIIEFMLVSKLIYKSSGITSMTLLLSIYKSFVVSVVAGVITVLFYELIFINYDYWISLILSALVVFFSWLVTVFMIKHPLYNEIIGIFRSLSLLKLNKKN